MKTMLRYISVWVVLKGTHQERKGKKDPPPPFFMACLS